MGGFFSILWRQRFWIIVGFAITFGLAFFYILTSPLTYTSTISILIDARDRQPIGSDQAPLPQQADPIMVESQLKLMTSEAVLRRVINNEHLESDPEFAPSDHAGSGLFSFIDRGRVTAPAIDQITDALSSRISVKRPDRTYVVDMDVKASNPSKAARLADAIAKAFIDEERAASDAYALDQSNWILKRTTELRAKVEAAEKRVQDYKAQNGIVDVAGTLTQEQQLQDANRDLVAARAKAAEAQARVDQIRRIIASGKALDGTYDTINSSVIRQLRVQYSDLVRRQAAASQKYGTRHPEYQDIQEQMQAVRGQINDEMQRISSALTNEAQVARDNAASAEKHVKTLEASTTDTNQISLKLREYQRQADGERANYEKFLRANDSIRRDPTETPYARIVAPASFASKPSSPKVVAALLIALSGGLTLGIGLAIVMDYRRQPRVVAYSAPPTEPGPAPDPGPSDGPGGPGHRSPPPPPVVPQYAPPPPPVQVPITGRYPETGDYEETGSAKPVKPARRPLVADPRSADVMVKPAPSQAVERMPDAASSPAASQEAAADAQFMEASALQSLPIGATDPRDLLHGLITDLTNRLESRLLLTARRTTPHKTELALTLAKAAAARGHAVLVMDGDHTGALSQMAIHQGLPARIQFDRLEVNVLGIPCPGDGVVFVLPLQTVAHDLQIVDSPFIDCEIGAVIVDGPELGPALAGFREITDTCYLLDESGHLHVIELDKALADAAQSLAATAEPDMSPRRFAQMQSY